MAEKPSQIEREIEQTRAELSVHLHELEYKVRDLTDWRQSVRKKPFTMIGLAFGGGFLLGAALSGRNGRWHERGAQ